MESLLPTDEYAQVRGGDHLTFHVVGDVGGIKRPEMQLAVADAMARDAHAAQDPARFLYILGDVVYYNGEAKQYYPQFYEPYADYLAPILAVPGNHDGSPVDDATPSLAAFVANLCTPAPQVSRDARDARRLTMTQPNVYFTLTTPFVTILGLCDNVVDDGYLDDAQKAWMISEMQAAPADIPLLITSHHPMLSLDKFHGPSEHMEEVLDEAVNSSGRTPTCVFAGHVHNYQRWEHVHPSGDGPIPFIVSGGGGYWNLHQVQASDRRAPTLPYTDPRGNRPIFTGTTRAPHLASGPSATRWTTPWPSLRSDYSRPNSSAGSDPGGTSMTSSWPPSNGSTGTTTGGCTPPAST